MLTTDTKHKIDSARDILVGKVPDPKAQVEQITNALIYKFMDDMDQESVELGGKLRYFTNGYEKYAWTKLMDPSLGGLERLSLYAEALTRMSQNPHLPQLFRDIFKDTFLPYRDPETLSLFLKQINEFTYHHSEELGNSFEYLLSVLGSQGDAGQFRTPRHIIDFIVSLVDPKKTDRILDPACGTAGFLISAYKHILAKNKDSGLTPDERKRLVESVVGYDISPDMVKLSRVNMYLHGFPEPHITEYDTLSSEDKWDDTFDVILANPPFMSPKGGIRPHKRFSIQANRSEVLFVDYIAEHLNSHGRAGIIVPEGIIFQSGTAYKSLRKMLIEDYLVGVISLPAGVFNPYAGVKTSILWLDKKLAKAKKEVIFARVENDGFSLGSQRRASSDNDLPQIIVALKHWADGGTTNNPLVSVVEKSKLAENGDYNLSASRYVAPPINQNQKWPVVEVGDVAEVQRGTSITSRDIRQGNIPVVAGGQGPAYSHDTANRQGNTVTVSGSGAYAGFVNYFKTAIFVSDASSIRSRDESKVLTRYIYWLLKGSQDAVYKLQTGMGQPHVYAKDLAKFLIPLPPIEVQIHIIQELDNNQTIIDSARLICSAYKPSINISAAWEGDTLANLSTIVRGSSPRPRDDSRYYGGTVPRLMVADVTRDGMYVTPKIDTLTEAGAKLSRPMEKGDLVMAVSGQPGLCAILAENACIHDGFVGFRNLDSSRVLPEFAYHVLTSMREENSRLSTGAIFMNLNTDQLKRMIIPLPPLDVQQVLVSEIKLEYGLVNANRQIIGLFEAKIKSKIAEVWGE
jgi:type I restriction enzyme M protein